MKFLPILFISVATAVATSSLAAADQVDEQLAVISHVAGEAEGSRDAKLACRELAKQGTAILPRLLDAMDTENIVAANWLRTVYDEVVAAELAKSPSQLPIELLKGFVGDAKRQGRVRRHVLATLDRIEPEFGREFVPRCLDDPEFRNDAVAEALRVGDAAKAANQTPSAIDAYRNAFSHARESSQITAAADKLTAVGETVSIVDQMGLVVDWYFVGPFDAPEKTGFQLSFAPEQSVDLNAEYDGKGGQKIRWKRYRTNDRLGSVDLVQAIAPVSEAVGYAYTELNAPEAIAAQIRCGADDNLTVWLNDERVFGREQWLNGIRLDRFVVPVQLKEGPNKLLVKACQGPQHSNKDVANNWTLQLRICKPDGATAGLTSLLPAMAEGAGQ